ncbi:AAA family ATPase [Reichenbachiella agariperforans]|uniref:AAA family ATPase n=1 Tax=Reichenbachiella agariperforans TaxID=156994 RepID=UPI001C098D82|nr:AAA family ATPase [Reichenbachiella agariperforans]MBU2915434.1 AAA family ATPase [Reichenbachiella agariperforans]
MASTTANKKAIVDFLWEWTINHDDWSKLLISKVVATESPLSITDRQCVFNYFLQSIDLHTGLTDLTVEKPVYTPTAKTIELDSLSDINGVNRLASNQTLNFAKNITVIYGENGTGKTGYSRILKTLGFSYDNNKTILSNVYAATEPQTATINFKSNNIPRTFTWNGANTDSELENISVFNSNCVQFSISDRSLIVSPIGFHLFLLVSNELNELAQLLQKQIAAHPITLLWLDNLTLGTPQQAFVATLSATSSEQTLSELSVFTPKDQAALSAKESELSTLNKALLEAQIQTLRNQIAELDTIKGKIQAATDLLNDSNWQALLAINKAIAALESKAQTGLKDIADERGIEFYQTTEFKSFIRAAESYIKIIDKPEYPQEDDTCVYCLQPLDESAKELLKSYRTLLNDKTQENLEELRKRKAKLIQLVSQVDINLTFHQYTFGTDENQAPIQPKAIMDYNTNLGALKTSFTTDTISLGSTFIFNYQVFISFLTEKRVSLNDTLSEKTAALANLASRELQLRKEIAELKDRKILSGKVPEVKTAIANHKIVNTLNANSGSFNTNSISRKTSSAREELVRQDFENIFKLELKALRKANLKINLSFGTDRGNSKVFQNISRHALADILSEGEQKAIALAEFLTELQLDNTKAPVIFDDPVNSLDHRITDEVVKRLIELSKNRQVIVFTHSILLLHSFIQQSELDHNKQAGVSFLFHRVKTNFGITGILDEVEEVNSYSYYTKKLNAVLQTTPNGQDEGKLTAEGYGHLRSAIEISVEDDLFRKTIKRYKKGVAFPSLLRVNGSKVDTYKGRLNDIYEKCCVSIDGHSSPEELHSTPTIEELKTDFDEFKKIRSQFT